MSASKKSTTRKRKSVKGSYRGLVDLFQQSPFGIPPSPSQQVLWEAAKEAGWIPPWELERQRQQKRKAGKTSGTSRGGRKEIRRSLVNYALNRLNPKHQRKPYSNASFEALRRRYDHFLTKNADDPDPILSGILSALTPADRSALKKASDDTLLADLKAVVRIHRTLAQQLG
jgi:hypothetical protein